MLRSGSFEPRQGLVLFIETYVDQSDAIGRGQPIEFGVLQLLENADGLTAAACVRIDIRTNKFKDGATARYIRTAWFAVSNAVGYSRYRHVFSRNPPIVSSRSNCLFTTDVSAGNGG